MRKNTVTLALALSVPLTFPAPAIPAEGLEANRALARRWIEAGFNKANPAVVDEIFAEGLVINGQKIGREGLKGSMANFLTAFPDLQVTITHVLAEGDKVCLWLAVEATHRGEYRGVAPTGKRVRWNGADLFRFEGGRIAEAWFIDDTLGLMRQIGGWSPPKKKD